MMTAAPHSYVSRLLPLRLPRVCVAVTGSEPTEMVERAEALVRDNTFLEFRLDYLSWPALALPKIKRFTEYHPQVVAGGTCPRAPPAGEERGGLAPPIVIIVAAAAAGCPLL